MTQKQNNKKITGIRTKLLIYMAAFVLLLIVILAVFQFVLLPKIYKGTLRSQAKAAVNSICSVNSDSEDFEINVYECASKYKLCISVYEIRGNLMREIVQAHTQSVCLIHNGPNSDELIKNIYLDTGDKGTYVTEYTAPMSSSEGSVFASGRVINSDGTEMFTLATLDIQPIDATVQTLRYELIVVSIVMLICAAVIAYFVSRKISAPVVRMNDEAKKLAVGDYDVNFEGGDFRETKELAGTLNYAADELSKMDTMQKELIANISHDLRTPLTLISGYSEVMRDFPEEITPENMQIIIDESARLTGLVNDMLELSRLEGGKRELKREDFSLTDTVLETVKRFAGLTAKNGYAISEDLVPDIYVNADKTLVLQVLYNLMGNAINYTGEDKSVNVKMELNGDVCRVSVSDTGEGIPEEKLPYIWDRYYRTGDYHKRGEVGTGIGLSIVKNALTLHGAQYGVSSTEGIGSTFWFELNVLKK